MPLQALEEEVSAHYTQFDTVVTNGNQVDKERVDKLKEHWIDLEQQVDEKKMFVTAGLELQQVCMYCELTNVVGQLSMCLPFLILTYHAAQFMLYINSHVCLKFV